jgi:hypothetical protein
MSREDIDRLNAEGRAWREQQHKPASDQKTEQNHAAWNLATVLLRSKGRLTSNRARTRRRHSDRCSEARTRLRGVQSSKPVVCLQISKPIPRANR